MDSTTAARVAQDAEGFAAFGLDQALLDAVTALGYEEPTAIQREAIPALLAGRDVLGQAATGTGKTAAFALPMLHRIAAGKDERGTIAGVVLVPTRELAMQVAEAIHTYGRGLGIRVLPIYGGASMQQQLRALKRGVDVVVATPGRALDHLTRGTLALERVQTIVIDEADEMLDMGFADELEAILAALPPQRQNALFSATMAKHILAIAKRHLHDPIRVTIAPERSSGTAKARVREVAFIVQRRHKVAALARILDIENVTSAIVFCRTRTEVDELASTLDARGYSAEALHGGLSQEQRDRVLRRFRDGASDILVATDVAARGLDIEHVSHVVNFDVPSSPDAYIHRIGRTGRAGREGVAITLAEPRENRLLHNIEAQTKRKIAIETVPTVHELRTHRLGQTRSALEEALGDGDLDRYRRLVETLAGEHELLDIAAAAVRLLDASRDGAADDEADIPTAPAPAPPAKRPVSAPPRRQDGEITRLYIGVGRRAGVRPGDLVGAIANEAHITSNAIGAIEIADRFSLVEVPERAANAIIAALRGATIRGKTFTVRRDRAPQDGPTKAR